ncbi:MAG: hypothetical protein IJ630_06370 [Treponema sp.]|nr:hypothetical protein [Treponema sp.]
MCSRGGYLTSCSSDDGDDNKVTFTSQTAKVTNDAETLGVVTTVVTSADETIATADYNEDKSEIVITSKKAGSTTLTAREDADKEDYATISVTVAKDGKITTNVTKKVGEEAEEGESLELEASTIWLISDYFDQLDGVASSTHEGDSVKVSETKTLGGVTIFANSINQAAYRDNGSKTFTIDGEQKTVYGYVQLGANGSTEKKYMTFNAPAGTGKISVYAKSSNGSEITITDGASLTKAITLATTDDYPECAYTLDSKLVADTTFYIYVSGANSTNFKAIVIWTEAVVLDPPSASSFTANSSAAGYSITVDAAKETVTGLEYSVDNGTTWTKVESETIALTTYGTVKIRYAATEVAGASKAVSVTVAEYVDTTLPQAAAPEASNFTVVDIVNGKGSITLTSKEGIEYLNSSDEWVSAEASYEVTTAGKYKFRTAGVEGTSRASEAIEIEVGTYTLSVSAETVWDMTSHANAKAWNTIPERDASTNVAAIITTAADSYVGYLGKGLSVVSGTAFEYVASDRGLGYSKWAGDSATDDEKAANIGKIVPAVQTVEAMPGPFKVSVTPKTNKPARSLAFYVSKTADALFAGEPVYSAAIEAKEISYTYTGADEVFVGFGTISTDGTVYTEISKIVVVAAGTIPEDEFPATAVSFVDEEKNAITSLTLSKAQAVAGYELSTSLTPSYSTDKVTYAIKETETNGISVTDGKVTVAEDYAGNNTVTVVASARDGVTAELSVSVNAVIALTADMTVSVTSDTTRIKPDGTTKATLTATLSTDASDVTYTWKKDGVAIEGATSKTYEFTTDTAGTYAISVVVHGTTNDVDASAAKDDENNDLDSVNIVATWNYTELFTKYKIDDGDETSVTGSSWTQLSTKSNGASNVTEFTSSGIKVKTGNTGDFKVKTSTEKIGTYTCSAMIQFPKSSVASMTIPVKGNCTIYIPWGNNKAGSNVVVDADKGTKGEDRGLLAKVSGTAKIKLASDTSEATATSVLYTNPDIEAGKYEVVAFTYVGDAGDVVITCNKDETTAANGACYIGLIDVQYE